MFKKYIFSQGVDFTGFYEYSSQCLCFCNLQPACVIIKVWKKTQANPPYIDLMRPGFVGAVLTASGINNASLSFIGIAGCNIEARTFPLRSSTWRRLCAYNPDWT